MDDVRVSRGVIVGGRYSNLEPFAYDIIRIRINGNTHWHYVYAGEVQEREALGPFNSEVFVPGVHTI